MRSLFSLYVWIAWILILLVGGPITLVALVMSRRLGYHMVRLFCRLVLSVAGIRLRVQGAEKVDWEHTHVFMGNHQNMLDPFALVLAIRRHLVGIEKQENHRIPIYGWLARAWGNLPIDRGNPEAARETLDLAAKRLQEGTSIAILPEGTRTKDGSIGPFKKGGFHLALGTGADIVPFAFKGAFQVLQTGDWRVRPGTIEVVFGDAIPTHEYSRDSLDALMARVRKAISDAYAG